MHRHCQPSPLLALVLAASLPARPAAGAQTSAAPSPQALREAGRLRPGRRRPGMPLAPRLQNLGVHTFPVDDAVRRAQLFINQG